MHFFFKKDAVCNKFREPIVLVLTVSMGLSKDSETIAWAAK